MVHLSIQNTIVFMTGVHSTLVVPTNNTIMSPKLWMMFFLYLLHSQNYVDVIESHFIYAYKAYTQTIHFFYFLTR